MSAVTKTCLALPFVFGFISASSGSPVWERQASPTPSSTVYTYEQIEVVSLTVTTPLPSCPTGYVDSVGTCSQVGCIADIVAADGFVATDLYSCYTPYPVTMTTIVATSTCEAGSVVSVYPSAWGGAQTRCVAATQAS